MSRRRPGARRWQRQPPVCTIEGCEKATNARGLCPAHYVRWRKHGDPLTVLPNSRYTGAEASYTAVHHRLNRTIGPAAQRPCVDCSAPAEEWSYDHGDPDERTAPDGRPYSLDLTRYVPRCRSCHRKLDRNRNAA